MTTELTTSRLLLSPPTVADVPTIVRLAGNRDVSKTTLNLPHPYSEADAVFWLKMTNDGRKSGEQLIFAIRDREGGAFLGGIGLHVNKRFSTAELGYWIGQPYWGKGYVTEAARAVVQFAFNELKLRKVEAHHTAGNPASGRVMQKIGMQREGVLRKHVIRDGRPQDVVMYGVFEEEVNTTPA